MNDKHILDILDEKTFGKLTKSEKDLIENHTSQCSECFSAYKAAEVSAFLMKSHTAQVFEPSPYFHKRVMANIGGKQIPVNPFALFSKMWKASRPLVAMMTLIVVGLVGLTFFAPKEDKNAVAETNSFDNYSTDMVILDERLPTKSATKEQVFRAIYSAKTNSEK